MRSSLTAEVAAEMDCHHRRPPRPSSFSPSFISPSSRCVRALASILFLVISISAASPESAATASAFPRSLLLAQRRHDDIFEQLDKHELRLDDLPKQEGEMSASSSSTSSEFVDLDEDGEQQAIARVSNSSIAPANAVLSLSSSSCEASYGVLPCTDTVIGNLFLLAAYGYLLYAAAKMLSEGSELLLTVLDAGIIGGLLLPILGALPDSILILVSGLGGTQAEAQEQVLVGIGLLAGSIVMLLTLLWGSCLFLGRCDLEKDDDGKLTAIDKTLTKKWSMTETGVETDNLTMLSARIMTMSVIPFIVAQLPRIFNFSADGNIAVLIACVLSIGGLLAYCLYQVFTPWIRGRRKEIAQKLVIKVLALEKFAKHTGVRKLVKEDGELDEAMAERLFNVIDRDGNEIVTSDELRVMLNVSLYQGHGDEQSIEYIMGELDENNSRGITKDEFLKGMKKWCRELKLQPQHSLAHHRKQAEDYLEGLQKLEEEEDEEEGESLPPTKPQIIRKAVLLLLGGTIMAAVFADPLVDAVNDFSTASSIPSFFISFVLLPLASNSSEGVSSILFSSRKKKKNMSLTYSQIYGGVTMNSTMGLGIFLAVVYWRQLVWDFSSEVLVVCLVTVLMGLLASFRKVFPAWTAFIALFLYPFSLGLVAVLDYVAGWE